MRLRLVLALLILTSCISFNLVSGKKKQHYKVVTPAPVCIEKQESVFSVTGFLTFMVVAATAVSNVIADIDNNNNNNNNNDNNDNVNNNNQISDSADAMNMGNARKFSYSLTTQLLSNISLPYYICQSVKDIKQERFTPQGKEIAMVR